MAGAHMNGRRLNRDMRRRWIGGVCAGIAEHLGVPVFFIRLLALMTLVTPVMPLAVILYIIAVLRIPKAPRAPEAQDPEQVAFQRSITYAPSASFGQVRHRLRELEHRVRRMEAYVTSTEFELDQGLGRRPHG